ncbi:MAG: hypothetical protein ACFFGZ_12620 [Candidatus Thorarchaeota archaeon]
MAFGVFALSSQKTSFAEIEALVAEANNLGADIRIPRPEGRPLIILQYETFENKKPKMFRFRRLKEAKEWLLVLCKDLNALQQSQEQ